MSQNEEGTMCLPTPGLNIFLGAAVVVKRLPSDAAHVLRVSIPHLLDLRRIHFEPNYGSLLQKPITSHVCDLLAQQNQIVGEVHVFQLLQQGELDPGLVVTKGLSGSLFMELMHGC
ncbi:hypothetical protein OS493_020981 [Desmophyllum pertusum]|uniref:Uncharacterized protein n=1 Tax=Desmophyllum pertusum TaxID=174260 RepID=A0A9X0A000_9CNID|nr:hypothetical protein OS493_020981 [Desmophyllum pertusum]